MIWEHIDNIKKNSRDLGNDYTTGCLLDYNHLKEHYKIIAITLKKEQELDSDSKAIQQINFTGNIENQSRIFFIIEEAKESVWDFSRGTAKVF